VTPRPHWSAFIDRFKIGSDELARRWEHAERRIRENGVTYNIYTDPQGANRPLAIDPIPLLIAARRMAFHRSRASSSARNCSICCSRIFMGRAAGSQEGTFRPRCCLRIRRFCGH
jgi:hypothetical protein